MDIIETVTALLALIEQADAWIVWSALTIVMMPGVVVAYGAIAAISAKSGWMGFIAILLVAPIPLILMTMAVVTYFSG